MKHTTPHLCSLLLSIILLASCSHEAGHDRTGHHTPLRIKATQESLHLRSTLSDDGHLTWNDTDAIGLVGKNSPQTPFLYGGEEDDTSLFTGYFDHTNDNVAWAYYPYQADAQTHSATLTYTLPLQNTYTDENTAPMVATTDNQGHLCFRHTGAILRLLLTHRPDAAKVILTATGQDTPNLSGHVQVKNVTSTNCTHHITEGQPRIEYDVTVWMPNISPHPLYVPLQTGHYTTLSVEIQDAQGQTLVSRSLTHLDAQRAHLIITPEI